MLATECMVFDEKINMKTTVVNNEPDLSNNLLKKSQLCTADFVTNKGLDSGLYLYVDFHGHASKKGLHNLKKYLERNIFKIYICGVYYIGIFMYGNHFDNIIDNIECMVYPKLMSINNQNFHFTSCNFSERNMYSK